MPLQFGPRNCGQSSAFRRCGKTVSNETSRGATGKANFMTTPRWNGRRENVKWMRLGVLYKASCSRSYCSPEGDPETRVWQAVTRGADPQSNPAGARISAHAVAHPRPCCLLGSYLRRQSPRLRPECTRARFVSHRGARKIHKKSGHPEGVSAGVIHKDSLPLGLK